MSMPTPLLIKGGMIVNADRSWRADVLCIDGRIVAVGAYLDDQAPPGTQRMDAQGLYVMPGGIDPHTHLSHVADSPPMADDFLSGTAAALAGGTTTIIDAVVPDPDQSLIDAFEAQRHQAQTAVCSYGFHVTITRWDDNIYRDVATLTHAGVNSFSHYMGPSNALVASDSQLIQSFAGLLELGAMPTVHAENGALARQLQDTLLRRGLTSSSCFPMAHPPSIEGEATQRVITIAELAGVPLYLTHVSSQDVIDIMHRAHQQGLRVYGEVPVANLVLSSSVYEGSPQRAAQHVTAPPFRPLSHQRALWKAIRQGLLQTVSSRHRAFKLCHKIVDNSDFSEIPLGCNGIEERMAVCWHAGINSGQITPSEFVALTSTCAAKLFHLYPRKGVICAGADADIVLWDPHALHTWSANTHHSRSDNSIYEGRTTRGRAIVTIRRGYVVWQDNALNVEPGSGAWIPRASFAPQCAAARAFHRRHAHR